MSGVKNVVWYPVIGGEEIIPWLLSCGCQPRELTIVFPQRYSHFVYQELLPKVGDALEDLTLHLPRDYNPLLGFSGIRTNFGLKTLRIHMLQDSSSLDTSHSALEFLHQTLRGIGPEHESLRFLWLSITLDHPRLDIDWSGADTLLAAVAVTHPNIVFTICVAPRFAQGFGIGWVDGFVRVMLDGLPQVLSLGRVALVWAFNPSELAGI
ncbi:uncharacterized protein FIBRA_00884 [Fibroporia radiculosa]|uniref:Uncharacterized protein n=1 Tax=Fibroporia radiculosa TaxID=599839 RepID=J4HSE2_9APHY|nr:uncharacterized protein FIBRA_00884 [Fibroporia radiculosa]CCL98877.1 predicted protein [Fibroporia radiculosa]